MAFEHYSVSQNNHFNEKEQVLESHTIYFKLKFQYFAQDILASCKHVRKYAS